MCTHEMWQNRSKNRNERAMVLTDLSTDCRQTGSENQNNLPTACETWAQRTWNAQQDKSRRTDHEEREKCTEHKCTENWCTGYIEYTKEHAVTGVEFYSLGITTGSICTLLCRRKSANLFAPLRIWGGAKNLNLTPPHRVQIGPHGSIPKKKTLCQENDRKTITTGNEKRTI